MSFAFSTSSSIECRECMQAIYWQASSEDRRKHLWRKKYTDKIRHVSGLTLQGYYDHLHQVHYKNNNNKNNTPSAIAAAAAAARRAWDKLEAGYQLMAIRGVDVEEMQRNWVKMKNLQW